MVSVTVHGGTRNEEAWNFLQTLYWKHRVRWSTGTHTKRTSRLDTDAGKHRALKGGTKLGNWS